MKSFRDSELRYTRQGQEDANRLIWEPIRILFEQAKNEGYSPLEILHEINAEANSNFLLEVI